VNPQPGRLRYVAQGSSPAGSGSVPLPLLAMSRCTHEKPGDQDQDYDQDQEPENSTEIFLNVFLEGCPKKSKGSKPGLWLAFERSDR
jgi:hypothetical protein